MFKKCNLFFKIVNFFYTLVSNFFTLLPLSLFYFLLDFGNHMLTVVVYGHHLCLAILGPVLLVR